MNVKTIFLLIFLLINVNFVLGANIGISPAIVNFDKVLRNGYAERNVVITVDSPELIDIEISPRGEITNWLNFSESNFTVSNSDPNILKISVSPPSDVPNGNYTGFLRVKTSSFGQGVEGQAVSVVRSTLDLLINVEVTDLEIIECTASNFGVKSAELGDEVLFDLGVVNNGNVRIKPHVTLNVWDQDQISIVESKEFLEKEILPTTSETLNIRLDSRNLDLGQYWVDVIVEECYNSATLTFDILEEGALKAEGILLGIVSDRIVSVGDTSPLVVKFKNIGEKEVDAQFRGRITQGEKIIQILESDIIKVPISQENDFNFFFTPKEEGKYSISGRVFYSGKRTFESSSIIEAVSKKFNLSKFVVLAAYLFLSLLIIFLFYKIRKERVSYAHKLKRLKNGNLF